MLKKMSEKVDDFVNNYNANISFLDKLGLENSIRLFDWIRRMLWIVPSVSWATEILLTIVPAIKTLDRIFLFVELVILLALVANLVVSFIINRLLLYFNTRNTDLDPYERTDQLWDIQKKGDLQQSVTTGAIIALPFVFTILPYLEFLRQNPTIKGWTVAMTDDLNGNPFIFRFLIMSIPILLTVLIHEKMLQQERLHEQSINEWMSTFRYENKDLHSVLSGEPNNVGEKATTEAEEAPDPYIEIGTSIKTDDKVILPPANRKQNAVYYGPSGSGKSSTIFIPQIRQDIEHYLRYIRDVGKIRKDPDYLKKRGNIATHYLNGIAVIETSNELCKQVYDMAIAMGVPEDSIAYLDPTNEYSTGMNMLRGPTDTVVETMTNIIAGVKEGHKDFFAEAERTHLKHYILLLKFTAVMRNEIATFTDLTELYNDIIKVRERQLDLGKYVNILRGKQANAKRDYDKDPQNRVLRARYEELFDKYKIADDTLKWFNSNILPLWQGNSQNPAVYESGPHAGEQKYVDTQWQNVQGLKNTLDDLSKNQYLRRVLFRDTGFDLDSLLLNGGILLCNTAKAELKDQLSQRLGQMYLMSFQAATFRRMPDKVPMFALYADEFPDFVSDSFRSYIAQARKYGVATIVAAQSPSQLSLNNGQDFFNTLMSNMLTRGTFGDLGPEDARKLEPFFGQHTKVEENISEQEIELTADQDNNRRMISTRKTQVPNISANEIMALPPFTLAVRHPSRQGSSMFDLIQAHYLTDEEIRDYPDKFDPENNEADKKAYEAMLKTNIKVNPDFDEVDGEIIAELSENKEQKNNSSLVASQELNVSDDYVSLSNSPQTEGADADDDLRKPRKTPSNAENESNKDQSIIFTADDDDDAGPSAELTNNRVLDSKEIAQKKEEARKLASRAVHLSDKHGGNDRLKNGIKTDKEIPKVNSQGSPTITENVDDADADTEKKTVTEEKDNMLVEKDNMLVEKDNKLIVEKKNRQNLDKIKQANDAAHAKELKKQMLDGLSKELQAVANDSSITDGEKVSRLLELKRDNKDDLRIICGQDVASEVLRKIDVAIAKYKEQLNEPIEPIKKDDDLATIMAKSKRTGEKAQAYEDQLQEEEVAKELNYMIDDFIKNRDTDFDEEDDSELEDIMDQHGGDYE